MITPAMLTGLSTDHLESIGGNHRPFRAMQRRALADGLNLQPASSFRDFARQQAIWNDKFNGKRPLLDADSQPLQVADLTPGERCQAILRWSALPGASRHHWGSDLDVYDPDLLPADTRLQLEPWEYQPAGCQFPLTRWLDTHRRSAFTARSAAGRKASAPNPGI